MFSLRQALKMYDAIQERISDYEKEILQKLAEMQREECRGQEVPRSNNLKKGRAIRRRGEEPMRQALYRPPFHIIWVRTNEQDVHGHKQSS